MMTYATNELQFKLFMLRKGLRAMCGESWIDFCSVLGVSPYVVKKIYNADYPKTVKINSKDQDQLEAAYRKWYDE